MQTLLHAIDRAMEHKVAFLGTFFIVFTVSYGALAAVDFLPEPKTAAASVAAATAASGENVIPQTSTVTSTPVAPLVETTATSLPQSLTIDALDRTVAVLNPASNSVSSLDAALLKGVVRHPDSAMIGEEGNLFILGHSSYLPTVQNKNFQALNGIQNLKWGDTIRLKTADAEYTYRVEKVYKAKASALVIPVAGEGHRLTLATCNSFGSTDDRFIVEASLLSTKAL